MSVSVSRSDGLTVLTLTSDQSSVCPPLCQLLGALCYSPGCCSKKSRLAPHRLGAQTVLGALWIITALLHIGLGVLLMATGNIRLWVLWQSRSFPTWLGALFLVFGVCSVLSERYPRPIFVLLSGIFNLVGFALSICAIVWYSMGVGENRWRWNSCDEDRSYRNHRYRYNRWDTTAPTTVSPDLNDLRERCWEYVYIQWALTTSVFAILIAMSVLDLCVALSSSIISFKTMKNKKNQSGTQPLLEETKAAPKEL